MPLTEVNSSSLATRVCVWCVGRSSIVIVAEGAIDIDGKPIKSDDVKVEHLTPRVSMQFYSHLSHASAFSTLSWATIRASPFWATYSAAARPRPTIGSWYVARAHLNTHRTDRCMCANLHT